MNTYPQVELSPLVAWFEAQRRALPWRARDLDNPHPNPYAVLVSEVMLQQTQVATVIPFFVRWMERFPEIECLAQADSEELHRLWQGLGYYRRALHLHQTAQQIARKGWPTDLAGLLSLPGLGPYTAAAVASLAFQWPEPALDGNAFRVLARLLAIEGDPTRQAAPLRTWLRPSLERLGPSRLTQAIMELGATLCAPAAKCEACPLAPSCQARRQNRVSSIPPPKVRPAVKEVQLRLLAIEARGSWLLHPPRSKGLLSGLWRWPGVENAEDCSVAEAPSGFGTLEMQVWPGWTQVYTHRKEVVLPCALRLKTPPACPPGLVWVSGAQLATLPMGKRDQRMRELLLKEASPIAVETWPLKVLEALLQS